MVTEMDVNSIEALREDNDRFTLPDGRMLILHIELDNDTSVNDFDCYGRVEWTRDTDYGPQRPQNMTGRARIMDRDHYSTQWWEPYWDKSYQPTEEQMREEESRMRDLLRYGFTSVGLELLEQCPNCEEWHTSTTEWLGGIDNIEEPYLTEILNDMLAEMDVSV